MNQVLQLNRFSIQYRGVAKGRDCEAWREGICRGFCRLDVGPAGDAYIDCGNDFASELSLALATPRGSSARFARTRDLMQDGCDDFVLISASHGRIRVTQRNQTIELSKGQMCLTEISDIVYACGFSDLSYFNMTFKRRFGATPSDIQASRIAGHPGAAGQCAASPEPNGVIGARRS